MHPIARILAAAYLGLALVGAVVYGVMTVAYVDVAEVQNELGGYVEVTHVAINWSGNPLEAAHVSVYVNVTNPGRIVVGIQAVDFGLHMDNVSDARFWADPAKLADYNLGEGGFDQGHEPPLPVAPGETRVLPTTVTIEPGPRMAKFNQPDDAGKFHAVVWDVLVVYKLLDGRLEDAFYAAPYYDAAGVVPNAP